MSEAFQWREFKPTILFLVKFVGLYFLLNLTYGWYIERVYPDPDAATIGVTHQAAWVLSAVGWEATAWNVPAKPTTSIQYQARGIVSVYEGCNGLNVGIIFISFLVAFGPWNKRLAWFAPVGLLVIHVANLARIIGLFWVVLYLPNAVYFAHKYLFTAVIYVVVLVLWMLWLRMNFVNKKTV